MMSMGPNPNAPNTNVPISQPHFYPFHSGVPRPLPPSVVIMHQQSIPYAPHPNASSSTPPTSSSTISLNRSQRCGLCPGCKNKACGICNYCQDSPQFGGPGVKKQSCLERRCHRVLENRLQREAPTFKARIGCGNCEDCRLIDCQCCLVCLDKKFFNSRYMGQSTLCAKKRCNNATSLDTNSVQPIKRNCEWPPFEYGPVAKKRNIETVPNNFHVPSQNTGFQFASKVLDPIEKQLHILPPIIHQPIASIPHSSLLMPTHPTQSNEYLPPIKELDNDAYPFSLPSISSLQIESPFMNNSFDSFSNPDLSNNEKMENKEESLDPFVPPSYEMKNRVVLQPL